MVILALFALPICIADACYRRIPNIYLFFMVYFLVVLRVFLPLHSLAVILSIIGIALVLSIVGMGFGDAKLLIIAAIALNLPSYEALFLFVCSVYVMAILQVIVMGLTTAKIPRSIPLAFAIFLGSALYLAA